jgi:hypothetical protein
MSDGSLRATLWILSGTMLAALGLFILDEPRQDRDPLPHDSVRLARRLALSPTDWQAASAISERALDGDSPHGLETWRAADALATQLAPHDEAARAGYVRAGLFHWDELGEADRRAVLATVAPTLHKPANFYRLAGPLFELTGDLSLLRRAQPHTVDTIAGLSDLAVVNGRFEDYRQLRHELVLARTGELMKKLDTLSPSQIVTALPSHLTTDDQPMVVAALRALEKQPLEVDSGRGDLLEQLIDYAVTHSLPLAGLKPAIHEKTWAGPFQRAELARALGEAVAAREIDPDGIRPQRGEILSIRGVSWSGFCGPDVCRNVTADATGPLSVTVEAIGGDEVPPYVECYVDDARVWEGAIVRKMTIPLVPAGRHRVEILLANPLTRNRRPRRIRVS